MHEESGQSRRAECRGSRRRRDLTAVTAHQWGPLVLFYGGRPARPPPPQDPAPLYLSIILLIIIITVCI